LDELIAIQASVWGRATAVGENVVKAIEIYNPKFWRELWPNLGDVQGQAAAV
jgi:hypothetical protein